MSLKIITQNCPAAVLLPAAVALFFLLPRNLPAAAPRQRVTIGNGSGHLHYPNAQSALKLEAGDTLCIRPGIYSGLSLGNLSGSAAAPITVVCDSNTVFTTRDPQPNDFPNIAHVRFENFHFVDYNSTCLRITGQSHDLLFKNFHITNASGWSFHIYDPAKVFNGTKESAFYNFKWENVVVDGKVNGSAISSSDYQPVSNLKSVLLDFEIYRCTFRHFDNTKQAFPVIGLDKCFNLQVHECSFSDIGMAESPIGHNVCICGAGYFKVFNNRFTRQWANDVRVWPMKLNALGYDGADAVNRFYNNISWEKRKYPMYEHNHVPQTALENSAGFLSRTASEVYFNTLYRSRKAASSKDPYVATLVDVYGPDVTIKHNLVIEPEADAPFDPARNHVYHLGAGPQRGVVAENNLVLKTLEQSGLVDAESFAPAPTSPARDAATGRVGYITTDHNNRERYAGAAADVGAVENQDGALRKAAAAAVNPKPLFKDFMAINGHFTFKPDLYRQVGRLVRNYHNVNWDVKQPGDPITVPVCINKVNWKNDVYGRWQKAGYETDICIQFSGFQTDAKDYQRFWTGQEAWCHDYGQAMAACFGPSGREKLCTSIEIGNEPGSKFDRALFKTIFQQMAQGIRDADPHVKILTPAVQARPGDDYSQDLRGLYGEKDIIPLYDVINLHTYAAVERKNSSESPWNRSYPEDPAIAYLKVVDEAIVWRNEHAQGKEIWITEFGYDACTPEAMKHRRDWFLKLDWQGHTDLQQAQYLVRSFFAFAERDVQRAYIYYYDDNDSPSVHGCAGLTRKFAPKMSFWAVKQVYEMLGNFRFQRVVKKSPDDLCLYEFSDGNQPNRVIWAAWSPTGTRANQKDHHVPRETKTTLTDLPSLPIRVVGMAITNGEAPQPAWEEAGPSSVTLTIGESPTYLIMERPAPRN